MYRVRYGPSVTQKKVPASFYRTTTGTEPVRDWILSLSADDQKIVGTDIAIVEFGWPVGMPTCKSLGDGLWEVRSDLTGGKIGRVIFVMHQGQMVLLHGFVKKTQETPLSDIRIATKRQKEL